MTASEAGRRGFVALVVGTVFFSTSPVLTAGADSSGLVIGFWRTWCSAVILFAIATARGQMSWSIVRPAAVPGIAFGVATALFFTAVQITSVANATIITVLQPIPLLLAGRLVFRETLRRSELALVAVATAGTIGMIVAGRSAASGSTRGDLIAFGALLATTLYFASAKRARASVDALPLMVAMWIWGGLTLLPIVAISGDPALPVSAADWLRIAAIVAMPGTGHLLIAYAHRHVSLAMVGVLHLFVPVGAGLLSMWFLDQPITGGQVVGMAVTLVALAIYTRRKSSEH